MEEETDFRATDSWQLATGGFRIFLSLLTSFTSALGFAEHGLTGFADVAAVCPLLLLDKQKKSIVAAAFPH